MVVKFSHNLTTSLLTPFHSLFATLGHRRVRGYMTNAVELPVPVISVGNITFGGTAKTPTVEYLARIFSRRGYRPGVVLRGWMGHLERASAPPEVVSDGDNIYLDWKESGDEARLLSETLLSDRVPIAVGRDRSAASRILIDNYGADIILLDDGFQFTSLRRDFDLVLIDTLSPFGRTDGGQGLLREPIRALSRADAILLTRSEAVKKSRIENIRDRISDSVENPPPIFIARTLVRRIWDEGNGELISSDALRGCRVAAFAGIGNPLAFTNTIQSLGCELTDLVTFQDHHPYSKKDLARVNKRARACGADVILTTSKDAIRLNGLCDAITLPLQVVDIDIAIDDECKFFEMITNRIMIFLS